MGKCDKCGGCGTCAGTAPAPGAGGAPSDPFGREIFVFSKSITQNSGSVVQDLVVGTVRGAAAVDVFVRYRSPAGVDEDPFGAGEQWKLWAVNQQIRSQVGPALTTAQAPSSGATDGFVARRLFAVRDVPADTFDVSLNLTGVAAGNTVYFDLVIISWGREPTGIGPFELTTFLATQQLPTTANQPYAGSVTLGQNVAGGGVWTSFIFNYLGIGVPDTTDGTAWANVLMGAEHLTTPPTFADGAVGPLQVDANGNLKVTTSGAGALTSKTVSTAYESSRVRAGAATLRSVFVSSKAAAAGFIFIFDSATLPANATLPDFPPVPIPAGPAFISVDIAEGRPMVNGIVVAFSSTQATLTLGTADCWIEAHF